MADSSFDARKDVITLPGVAKGGSGSGNGTSFMGMLMALQNKDYYSVLGVTRDVGASEVRRAFLRLAKQWHPNAHALLAADERAAVQEIFILIQKAASVLTNPERAAVYRSRLPPEAARTPGPIAAPAAASSSPLPGAARPPLRPVPAPAAGAPPARPPGPAGPSVAGRALAAAQPGAGGPPRASQTPGPPRGMPTPVQIGAAKRGPATPLASTTPHGGQPLQVGLEVSGGRQLAMGISSLGAYEFRPARAHFQKAVDLDPGNRRARSLLHVCDGLEGQVNGKPEEAIKGYRAALAEDPDCEEAKNGLQQVEAANKIDQERKQSKKGLLRRFFFDE